jgi:Ca2+-binding RTX toxin-like protein
VNGIGGVYTNMAAGASSGEMVGDTWSGIEAFTGTNYADWVGGGSVDMTFNLGGGDDMFDTNMNYDVVDIVYGGAGNDTMWTGAGNDTLYGGMGNDYLNGEAGVDTVSYMDATSYVTVNLSNTGAQNTVGAGTDTILSVENLYGSLYNDTLTGDANANSIWGDAGNDIIDGGSGNDILDGGAGDDLVRGGLGNDTLIGGSGTDNLSYTDMAAAVTVNLSTLTAQNTGGGGTDTISGFENLDGTSYNDTLTGDGGNNIIVGGAGNDTINGGAGDDTIAGGLGNDTLVGGTGVDIVSYFDITAGVTVNLATTAAQNTGGGGTDTISGFEGVVGTAYDDNITGDGNDNTLYGLSGNDIINGGAGNDTIIGGAGSDTLVGGSGTDTLSYSGSSTGVTVNLATNTASGGDAAGDTISQFENVTGGYGNDSLTAAAAGSTLDGGMGNDFLYGGAGSDTFIGGMGNDTMSGGAGADLFFLQAGYGNDTITGGVGGGWVDALDLHDASGASYSGAFPSDWTMVLTSGSILSTGTETMTLSNDSSGYVQHTDGTHVNFSEIEQIRW